MVDLDHFKTVNDIYGHAVGDSVLYEVANRLRAVMRAGDTIAWLGGDEFAVIAGCQDPLDEPANLANRIITAVNLPIEGDSVTIEIDCSVGISLCPADGLEPLRLLYAADEAMHRAKRDGGGTYCYFGQNAARRLGSELTDN